MEFFFRKHVELLSCDRWKSKKIVLASRLKKRATIISKLSSRLKEMNLSRMHDIAGYRLLFQNYDLQEGDWSGPSG
jgi:ppGpp synthetase/RelA/SpoT-type nucleotidyltranferase